MKGRTGARPPLAGSAAIPTLTNAKSPYQTPEEEQEAREAAAAAQLTVWRQHLPDLFKKLAQIPDPRRPGSIRHRLTVLLFYGLLLFVFQWTSRREANRNATSPRLAQALREIFPDLDSIPHFDTVDRLLQTIPVETWETVLRDRITMLLRKHALRERLVSGAWVVAVDGTQKFARHQPFAAEALQQRVSDTDTRYRVYVLEAVLVAREGLTLPLMTEFAENSADASPETKQDCEQKAFHRLAIKLKQWFPRRRLLLVLDGLYPNGPIMTLCQQQGWDYFIVLPRNCLPSVWEDVEGLRSLDDRDGANRRTHHWGERDQVFTWANDIPYDGKDAQGHWHHRMIHVAQCEESWRDADGIAHTSHWAWISAIPLTEDNIIARCNRAGRHRWAIETEYLVEKRHGDHFEHAFSYHWQAMKGWHYLMKIAHFLNLLTLETPTGGALRRRRGYQETFRFLRELWTGGWLSTEFLHAHQIGSWGT